MVLSSATAGVIGGSGVYLAGAALNNNALRLHKLLYYSGIGILLCILSGLGLYGMLEASIYLDRKFGSNIGAGVEQAGRDLIQAQQRYYAASLASLRTAYYEHVSDSSLYTPT
ncbi:hypothetical protein [Rickettsiales endosymbiont of Stachyamoeba lipophora]|uniref:hypothetical protein n=1 Tax=Rickettsiales endosymbiont of Stachyamoeba lipophora TaxID=2486578 RepID=UPI000F6520D7|nr:hypothetical protein [Rickettsiales endosymbiont of Stachyamoeba lipophora]AZL15522.1 hypothetical protein EF513_03005 [Rickettsiales endosymbiont of Stachyamoeba lipophora]